MADQNKQNHNGFALVEILLVILILGTAFVVLLGLQSSAVKKTIRDRSLQEAMLVARSIMSAIEIDPEQMENQRINLPASQVLKQFGGREDLADDEQDYESVNNYTADLLIEDKEIALPKQEPFKLKRVQLKLYWGDNASDVFETVLYIQGNSTK